MKVLTRKASDIRMLLKKPANNYQILMACDKFFGPHTIRVTVEKTQVNPNARKISSPYKVYIDKTIKSL